MHATGWLNLGLQLLTGGAIVAAIKELGQRVEVVLGPEGESLIERVHKDRVRVRWLAARPKKMEAALQAFNFLQGKGHDTQGGEHTRTSRDGTGWRVWECVGTFFSVWRAAT